MAQNSQRTHCFCYLNLPPQLLPVLKQAFLFIKPFLNKGCIVYSHNFSRTIMIYFVFVFKRQQLVTFKTYIKFSGLNYFWLNAYLYCK
jgi:hypothetical protein